MKRHAAILVGPFLVLAVSALLWTALGSPAYAKPGCLDFHAIAQASLLTSTPLKPTDAWGGPLYGTLDGQPFLAVLSGNDGQTTWHGAVGQGRSGSYTVCVGYPACTDTFAIEVPNSVFPLPPGQHGVGRYNGNSASIVGGTGKFQYATGNLSLAGPFTVWPDAGSPFGVSGRWNVELSGNVCGVN